MLSIISRPGPSNWECHTHSICRLMAGKPWVGIGRVLSVCRLSFCLSNLWIVVQRCEIDLWLLWSTTGKPILDFQNSQKNLTSTDDLEEVMSRLRKWKWPASSEWLLLGPACIQTKMFTIALLIRMHIVFWPWLTFMGHFKVTNVTCTCGIVDQSQEADVTGDLTLKNLF